MKNKILVTIALLLMWLNVSCSGGLVDKTIGAGIDLISNGINANRTEEIEVNFPVTEIKVKKLKWYEFYRDYEDKTISTEAYEISLSFDKAQLYILINIKPTFIKGYEFNHYPIAFNIELPFENKKYYEYDLNGNPFEIELIETEEYYIIRIQKLPVIIEVQGK